MHPRRPYGVRRDGRSCLEPTTPVSPRAYLLDRFRTDAAALRQRAEFLRDGTPAAGPDTATSRRMADACDAVIAMLEAIPDADDASTMINPLTALIPMLEQRAAAASGTPPVRAVYAGAATRIREIADAESRHEQSHGAKPEMELEDEDDDE